MRKIIMVLLVIGVLFGFTAKAFCSDEDNNPFRIFLNEVLSFIKDNNVGVSGYYSNESDKVIPTLSAQLGTSKHQWLVYGINTPISEEEGLRAVGAYTGLNGKKFAESSKTSTVVIDKFVFGYNALYYFNDIKNGDNIEIEKGWDTGWFGLYAVVKF